MTPLTAGPWALGWPAVFVLALVTMAVSDIRWRRLSNLLILYTSFAALLFWALHAGLHGLGTSLLGGLVAALVLLPAYAAGWVGAADVKVLFALGAMVGLQRVPQMLLVSALFAGLMSAMSLAIWRNFHLHAIVDACCRPQGALSRARASQQTMPLAVCLAAGAAWVAQGGWLWRM